MNEQKIFKFNDYSKESIKLEIDYADADIECPKIVTPLNKSMLTFPAKIPSWLKK